MGVECFVTGGTGCIGQHLVEYLSAQGHTIRVLMRRPERLAELREQIDTLGGCASRVFAVAGDLQRDTLGLSLADREVLRHASVVFHLGAHFANRHGIARPDIRQSLQHTATFVNSHCLARG